MSEIGWLLLYSSLVLMVSLFGGYLPFRKKVTHSNLQLYLSVSAGVMLGASFFHLMPDAMELSKGLFGWWMSLGVVGLFCIERFVAPHSHEVGASGHNHHDQGHNHGHHDHEHHDHEHHSHHDHGHEDHVHSHETVAVAHASGQRTAPSQERRAAPAIAGWTAVMGLTMHTFMNGVGMAAAVRTGLGEAGSWWALPGIALFAAIVLHKPADALAISVVLSRKGVKRSTIAMVQVGFGVTVAIGAMAFYFAAGHIEAGLQGQLTGAALSISAGTLLFIALSDLLPEVQFHRHDRLLLFSALLAGVALMGAIALLEDHNEGHESHDAPAAQHAQEK